MAVCCCRKAGGSSSRSRDVTGSRDLVHAHCRAVSGNAQVTSTAAKHRCPALLPRKQERASALSIIAMGRGVIFHPVEHTSVINQ